MSAETNPLITIPRTLFAQMRQKCFVLESREKEFVVQTERVKELEDQCYQAERSALQAEAERCRLMLQIFEDSPNLTTSLLLTQKPRVDNSAKGDNSCPQFSADIYKPVPKEQPEINANLTGPPLTMPLHSGGISKLLFNKLSVELWITKKNLIAALKEIQTPKISFLERHEFEEIVRRLEEDLLTLRHQYAQIRLAAHAHPDDVITVVGDLQDKVRNQEKMNVHLQAMLSRLFPGSVPSSTHMAVTPKQDSNRPTAEEKALKEAQTNGRTKPMDLGNELIEARRIIGELMLKCQRLGGEYREKLERVQGSEVKGQLSASDVSASPKNELIQQLQFMQGTVSSLNKEKDLLTKQLAQVRGEMSALNDRHQQNMAALKDRHRQDMADLNDLHEKELSSLNDSHQHDVAKLKEDKIQSQRIIDHLSKEVKTTRAQVLQYEQQIGQLLRSAPDWSSCAQEVPAAMSSVLLSRGLLVDRAESLESGSLGWEEPGKEEGGSEEGGAKGGVGQDARKLGGEFKYQKRTEQTKSRIQEGDQIQQTIEQESTKVKGQCPKEEPPKNS